MKKILISLLIGITLGFISGFICGGFLSIANQKLFKEIVSSIPFVIMFALIVGASIMAPLGALSWGELMSDRYEIQGRKNMELEEKTYKIAKKYREEKWNWINY